MEELLHRGVAHDENPPGRGSGRYGFGTGANPGQHQDTFTSRVEAKRRLGLKDSEIAKALLGDRATVNDLKTEMSIEKNLALRANIQTAEKLYKKYKNRSAVAREMGLNESSVRSLLNPVIMENRLKYSNTADKLRDIVDKKEIVDISKDTELYLGVPQYTKDVAVAMLTKEGYTKAWVKIPQVGTQFETTITVLAKPGIPWAEIQKRKFDVKGIEDFTPDMGKTWWTPEFPESLDSKRVFIRYGDQGGSEKDGVIELRKGVEDISLGGSRYSQVRIAVDGTHYMKGMAIYSDDIPKGYDVVYNTNKKTGTPMMGPDKHNEVLKRLKKNDNTGEVDRDNPFGALIKSPKEKDGVIMAGGQRHYIDKDGKEKLSPINKLQDEGDWDSWSRNLSSQFLSKQPLQLIKEQIKISTNSKRGELDEILSLNNPVVKKRLLKEFSEDCDANAADLSVKGFKNQAFQVLLPVPKIKETEIYAPNYDDGDTVALVRYPHGGIFEIPVLTVNNKSKPAKAIMEKAHDAVGINPKTAEILSGADFDGDTALVIPVASNKIKIATRKPLEGLKGFDAKTLYKLPDSAPEMKSQTKQTEMGKVTNLITDMTVGNAGFDDIEKAVKHSMVVIDAEKHHLNYKQSERDNDIKALKKKYQGINPKTGEEKGASTVLSRANREVYIDERKEVNRLSDMTPEEVKRWENGEKIYHPTGKTKTLRIENPKKMTPEELELYNAGKKVYRKTNNPKQIKVPEMDTVSDARELVRDKNNKKEMAYAEYANDLKALANQARREYRKIKANPVNKTSQKTYAKEIEELEAALRKAKKNNPRERNAQILANTLADDMISSQPDMDYEHKQRARSIALAKARAQMGASKERIEITDKQWEAIQANAISTAKLEDIVANSDIKVLRKRATPKPEIVLPDWKVTQITIMANSDRYTQKEIADKLGISASKVSEILKAIK